MFVRRAAWFAGEAQSNSPKLTSVPVVQKTLEIRDGTYSTAERIAVFQCSLQRDDFWVQLEFASFLGCGGHEGDNVVLYSDTTDFCDLG